MKSENPEMQDLYRELENYEKKGVRIKLDGSQVSPLQVIAAYEVKERGSYMRDYVLNPSGYIEELSFYNIAES
ncbi:MAG: hypothetical protein HFH53_08725 [Hespellia sp.]|jgi:hypothetical protein|nr:hypothetical protein [Hespellia sp.]